MYAVAQKIGQISVAHDWHEALRSGCDSFWVSCSIEDQKTVYGEINVKKGTHGSELECSSGFEANLLNKNVLVVKNKDLHITSYFFAQYNAFENLHHKAVRSLDISPAGGLAVSCGDDGGLYVWQTDDGTIRRALEGHVLDVTRCRFFPSGVVVLSGGADMRLKIWSVEDGSCPVTLTGHKGAITGSAIIDRGRNIISCGRDGAAKLWDCGSAECLWTVENSSSVVNSCCVFQHQSHTNEAPMVERSEKESGTEGKLLLLARENGYLDGIDLFSKNKIFSVPCHAPINDCCFVGDNMMAAGLEDGRLVYYDIRNTRLPQRILKYGKSSINCVQSFHGDSILIGRGDGSCCCIRNQVTSDVITMEMSGPNCDPLFDVKCHENFVYTTCRDSVVRKYKLDLGV